MQLSLPQFQLPCCFHLLSNRFFFSCSTTTSSSSSIFFRLLFFLGWNRFICFILRLAINIIFFFGKKSCAAVCWVGKFFFASPWFRSWFGLAILLCLAGASLSLSDECCRQIKHTKCDRGRRHGKIKHITMKMIWNDTSGVENATSTLTTPIREMHL